MNDTPDRPDDLPDDLDRRRVLGGIAALGASVALAGCETQPLAGAASRSAADLRLDDALRHHVRNIVVIYAENRSFANLYGDFPGVQYPLSAVPPDHAQQLDRDGKTPLRELPKIWGGLVPQAQEIDGKRYMIGERDIRNLPNAPFLIRDAQGKPLPNNVITRDLWHRFYQNQMQINAGRNDQFAAWADSGGLVMGHYRNSADTLRLWNLARQYTLCDNFFMAAFGGSWLNHMYLISAQAPLYPDAHKHPQAKKLLSVVEGDDPTGTRLKVAGDSPASALDGPPKFVSDGPLTPDGYGVNTMAPPYQPSYVPPPEGGNPAYADPADHRVLPPQGYATIGDRLSDKGVDWAWYSGAWQYALEHRDTGDVPDFQYHHQPFNYFVKYAPGTEARRRHLRDAGLGDAPSTNRLLADIDAGRLPAVTFYKPQGNLNMHAGYADIASGDRHIATVIEHIQRGPQWANTVIIMTHDENGGWWDPVAPPLGDRWGPGSRIPALVIAPFAKKGYVDHTLYDTNSILRFISRVHGLVPLDGVASRNQAFAARGQTPPGDLTNALDIG
ncbi:acid phosphatase [Burkholderia stagnalis]|uniref:phospholipase C n=1 Tax=Burkholderia stagnalis TaxID=1503054 RepID=A0A107ACV1_9BURK|nr:acid phosphatase [Burkholderia stagnalis]KAB0639584.1 acid phosphatase [Burkholderia stagnalis]KVO49425.1 acid phosphatase [Burkholderia stagnalis]KVO72060.1 acid phosphatase [Burkholderia stagnalis]KVW62594.1 acid phosphatase [Burkholderia stagnalis]KVW72146.1 acid phosphatase [Burkholderia stagnalis]